MTAPSDIKLFILAISLFSASPDSSFAFNSDKMLLDQAVERLALNCNSCPDVDPERISRELLRLEDIISSPDADWRYKHLILSYGYYVLYRHSSPRLTGHNVLAEDHAVLMDGNDVLVNDASPDYKRPAYQERLERQLILNRSRNLMRPLLLDRVGNLELYREVGKRLHEIETKNQELEKSWNKLGEERNPDLIEHMKVQLEEKTQAAQYFPQYQSELQNFILNNLIGLAEELSHEQNSQLQVLNLLEDVWSLTNPEQKDVYGDSVIRLLERVRDVEGAGDLMTSVEASREQDTR